MGRSRDRRYLRRVLEPLFIGEDARVTSPARAGSQRADHKCDINLSRPRDSLSCTSMDSQRHRTGTTLPQCHDERPSQDRITPAVVWSLCDPTTHTRTNPRVAVRSRAKAPVQKYLLKALTQVTSGDDHPSPRSQPDSSSPPCSPC